MGTGIGRQGAVVVVATGGVVRRVRSAEVAHVVASAIDFGASGLEERAAPAGRGPGVVSATLRLTHPGIGTRLAARFVGQRVGAAGSVLVLRTVAAGHGDRPLAVVAPIPIPELTDAMAAGLLVPVGEPTGLRYATPGATLAMTRSAGSVALAARLLTGHRCFMGDEHCPGDAALLRMAGGEVADPLGLRSALVAHESVVVSDLLRDAGAGARLG